MTPGAGAGGSRRPAEPPRSLPLPPSSVLFDLDGVLADSFDVWVEVLGECRARRGLASISADTVRGVWGQGIVADRDSFFPEATPAELAREYDEAFEKRVGQVKAVPGAGELLRCLHRQKTPLAVVTNSPARMARAVLATLEMQPYFDVVCGGDEVARGKPDPALVELALRRLGAAPDTSLLIGDTMLDVEAARAAGVGAIGLGVDADLRTDRLTDLIPLLTSR